MKNLFHLAAAGFCAVVILALSAHADGLINGDEIIFRAFDAGSGVNSYVIHRYLTAGDGGNFTPPSGVEVVDYLVVAGGGGGGNLATGGGGGGGAGGMRTGTVTDVVPLDDYVVVVGAGGAALQNGGPSSALGVSTTGGGAGAGGSGTSGNPDGGSAGGSGGGGRGQTHNVSAGTGISGEGNSGGLGYGGGDVDGQRIGGGGGGAGSSGGSAGGGSLSGGAGLMSDIDGIERWYAGGGGGGGRLSVLGGVGGSGVGGAGGGGEGQATNLGGDGAANTGSGGGGGGGGAAEGAGTGGSGADGIVVLRYALEDVTDWNAGYALKGNVGRLRIEDTVATRVVGTDSLSIMQEGELFVGAGASLTVEENASLTVSEGAVLGGSGVIYGGLTLDEGAKLAFDPDAAIPLTVHGTVNLGNLSVADLVGLTEDVELKTYTLIEGDSATWTFIGMGNFGAENAVEIGESGKFAYFEEGSLKLVVIPEPHTLGLLLAAGALLALRRRFGSKS